MRESKALLMPEPKPQVSRPALHDLPRPLLALAPMQDITDLAFWNLQADYGEADLVYTPYFRVHATSRLNRTLLGSITQSPPHRRVIAQIIGEDIPSIVRTALELQQYRIAAIDLNLGCPAPIVCRKKVGGGLLRIRDKIDAILAALRSAVTIPLTVKTRLGYDSTEAFVDLLELFRKNSIDLITVHARTVKDMYGGHVQYDLISEAVRKLSCPVLANGDIVNPQQGLDILSCTGAHGLMVGRGAIRNPWIFAQIRAMVAGRSPIYPTGREMRDYLLHLQQSVRWAGGTEHQHVERMKKHLQFIGPGIDPSGLFLHQILRVRTVAEFDRVVHQWLDHRKVLPLSLHSEDPPAISVPHLMPEEKREKPSRELRIPELFSHGTGPSKWPLEVR